MRHKRLIDFCCKAGGTSMGYHMAGFDVTGVDKDPQPNFQFRFWQDDITKLTDRQIANIGRSFDAVAGSPPCQGYGDVIRHLSNGSHPMLIEPTRQIFEAIGLPYVIENVPGAPLIGPVMCCGSAYGLRVQRHRLFESNVALVGSRCDHQWQERHKPYVRKTGRPESPVRDIGTWQWDMYCKECRSQRLPNQARNFIRSVAMGIDWMTNDELNEAIPPAYTYDLGKQLMAYT